MNAVISKWSDFSDEQLLAIRNVIKDSAYGNIDFPIESFYKERDGETFLADTDEYDLLSVCSLYEKYGVKGVLAWVFLVDGDKNVTGCKLENDPAFLQAIEEIEKDRHSFYWIEKYRANKEGSKFKDWEEFSLEDLKRVARLMDGIGGYVSINLNDTFAYACAWGLDVKTEDLLPLSEVFNLYGNTGVIAWSSIKEEVSEPIAVSRWPNFHKIKKEILDQKDKFFVNKETV